MKNGSDSNKDSALGAVAQQAWAHLARGNMQGVLDACADDVQWRMMGLEQLLPDGGLFIGKTAVGEFMSLGPQLYDFARFKLEITATYVADPFVILEFTMDTPLLKGGHHRDERIIVFKIVNGKICSAREYTNTAKVERELLSA